MLKGPKPQKRKGFRFAGREALHANVKEFNDKCFKTCTENFSTTSMPNELSTGKLKSVDNFVALQQSYPQVIHR